MIGSEVKGSDGIGEKPKIRVLHIPRIKFFSPSSSLRYGQGDRGCHAGGGGSPVVTG